MRTKNGKRIGPVPIMLVAVFALAALLSAGLMLTTGAQPAAAQDDASDASCKVLFDGIADATPLGTDATPQDNGNCVTTESTGTVAIPGNADDGDAEDANKRIVWVYAKDGNIAGGATANVYAPDAEEGTTAAPAPTTRFSWIKLEIAEGTPASRTGAGVAVPAKLMYKNVVVTPASGKSAVTLYIYYQNNSPFDPTGFNHDADGTTDAKMNKLLTVDAAATSDAMAMVMVVFLGKPAVGKDGGDRNGRVEDYMQCVDDPDEATAAVLTGYTGDAREGNTASCTPVTGDIVDTTDKAELRSKLLVTATGDTATDRTELVLDGKSKTHTVTTNDTVTLAAIVTDSNARPLIGAEVEFAVSSDPAGIGPKDREVVAKKVVATASSPADSMEMVIATAIARPANVAADSIGTVYLGDAIAEREITDLSGKSYRVTVDVTANGVKLGTVIIARADKPAMLDGAIYNDMCIGGGADKNQFDMSMKDCAKADPARFGRNDMFAVKAMVKDSHGTELSGDDGEWMIKDLAGSDVVSSKMDADPLAYILTVKKDAPLGMHTLTLTHDSDDVADVALQFNVAGPPVKYTVDPMGTHYTTSSRVTFTVSALDENDGVPDLKEDDPATTDKDETNNKVKIDAIYGTLRGVERGDDENHYLVLDLDTGMETFTYTLPRDAKMGEKFEVTVGEGDMAQTVTVVNGEMVTAPAMPTNVRATATSDTAITVSWGAVDGATSYKVERGTSMDYTDSSWMTIAAAATGTSYMDSGLMAETTYYYRVTATNSAGMSDPATAMATTQASPGLTAPTGVTVSKLQNTITVSWTPNSAHNAVQIKAVLYDDAVTRIVDIGTYNPVSNDPGIHTFRNVAAGTYKVTVASFRPGDGHKLSLPLQTVEIE